MQPVNKGRSKFIKPVYPLFNAASPLVFGLQSFHAFTEYFGGKTTEASGRQLVASNSVQKWDIGNFGKCPKYTGLTDAFNCGNYGNGLANWSISAWVNYTGTSGTSAQIAGNFTGGAGGIDSFVAGVSSSPGYALFIPNNTYSVPGAIGGVVQDNAGNHTTGYTTTAKNDGNWHHVVVTCASFTTFTIYVDGVSLVPSNNGDNTPVASTTTTDNFAIGANDLGDSGYTGLVDLVGLWNRVLTFPEVKLLYESPLHLIQSTRQIFSGAGLPPPVTLAGTGGAIAEFSISEVPIAGSLSFLSTTVDWLIRRHINYDDLINPQQKNLFNAAYSFQYLPAEWLVARSLGVVLDPFSSNKSPWLAAFGSTIQGSADNLTWLRRSGYRLVDETNVINNSRWFWALMPPEPLDWYVRAKYQGQAEVLVVYNRAGWFPAALTPTADFSWYSSRPYPVVALDQTTLNRALWQPSFNVIPPPVAAQPFIYLSGPTLRISGLPMLPLMS